MFGEGAMISVMCILDFLWAVVHQYALEVLPNAACEKLCSKTPKQILRRGGAQNETQGMNG